METTTNTTEANLRMLAEQRCPRTVMVENGTKVHPLNCPDCNGTSYANPEFRRECPVDRRRWNAEQQKVEFNVHDVSCQCRGRSWVLPPAAELDGLLLPLLPEHVQIIRSGSKVYIERMEYCKTEVDIRTIGVGQDYTEALTEAAVRAEGLKG